MSNTDQALLIMGTMSVVFDVMDQRYVDLDDFDEAVEKIGFNAEEFRSENPFTMIILLSQKLTELNERAALTGGFEINE